MGIMSSAIIVLFIVPMLFAVACTKRRLSMVKFLYPVSYR